MPKPNASKNGRPWTYTAKKKLSDFYKKARMSILKKVKFKISLKEI